MKNLVYFYHHSSYGCLEKQLRDYLICDKMRNFETYKELGLFNILRFFDYNHADK